MPKLCPKCGAIYGDNDRFCHADGSQLADHPISPPPTGSHPAPRKIDRDKYIGKTLLNQFEVLGVCGSGSMGTVYKARQAEIDRTVAVKILHPQLANQPEAVLRFHREAKIISNLNHPNIVHIYLFGHLPDGNLYIVQEFVDGRSLGSEMKQTFSVLRTIHIAKQILSAIGEAHAVGVIHRDLKPENIMLTRIGDDADYVKILDFGVAKKIVTQTFATKEGLIFGSPKYISPEAAMGEKIDARSDLYSVGVILYQMLAGQLPYRGATPIELLMEHVNAQPPPLRSQSKASDVPVELEGIIMRLLAKDPLSRYATASSTREALDSVERLLGGRMACLQPLHAGEPRPEPSGMKQEERVMTAQASDSFSIASRREVATVEDMSDVSYSDYTTQEDVIGTQELYAMQMRKERTKKIIMLSTVFLAIPVLVLGAYFGYGFLKSNFFPYDKVAETEEEMKDEGETVGSGKQAGEGEENKTEEKEPENQPKPVQVDITIENEEIPIAGTPVKFLAFLTNETETVEDPHYLIKRSDGVELKLSALELLGADKENRKFAGEYAFSIAGPYIITFASSERKYSPSVRIHIQGKSSGKKKKGGKSLKKSIIREIKDDEKDSKPFKFGPDLVGPPGGDSTADKPSKKSPAGIKIIEKHTDAPAPPPSKDWY